MVIQICTRCDHKWIYRGKSKYVTCPSCSKNWTLVEDEIEQQKLEMGYYKLDGEKEDDGSRLTEIPNGGDESK
jgi:uncharacterized Zn ribbon protein